MKEALIIFTRNLIYGKVKTRLAATVGNDKALEVYKKLIAHTYTITQQLNCDKIVFFADEIEANNIWKSDYEKQLQTGNNLGEKMMNAFNYCFKNDFYKVIIIGTDCPELSEDIINDAFVKLNSYDAVIGPAADGGYYLLGLKKSYHQLFENMQWSINSVFDETIKRCCQIQLSYYLLPVLHDIDEEKDLLYMNAIKWNNN